MSQFPNLLRSHASQSLQEQTDLWTEQIVQAWTALQKQQPLVQCITNSVATNYTANILLAAGASPAMIDHPFEAADFTQISAALSINLGTPTSEQVEAMRLSAQAAQQHNIPWVLDPVGYGQFLKWRSTVTDELLTFQPTVIRGNASEISTLAGNHIESKGVDSTANSADVYHQAQRLFAHAEVIAISGQSDYILCNTLDTVIQVNGGSPLQPKVTATGCALGALIAAYSAVAHPVIAALSAHVHFAIAGQLAHRNSQNIGSFAVNFMDQIHQMMPETIYEYADFQLIHAESQPMP